MRSRSCVTRMASHSNALGARWRKLTNSVIVTCVLVRVIELFNIEIQFEFALRSKHLLASTRSEIATVGRFPYSDSPDTSPRRCLSQPLLRYRMRSRLCAAQRVPQPCWNRAVCVETLCLLSLTAWTFTTNLKPPHDSDTNVQILLVRALVFNEGNQTLCVGRSVYIDS